MKTKTIVLPVLIFLAFGLLALCPMVRAVVPAPDGGYPGGNTAEGQSALVSLTTGGYNTAVGFLSLESNTDASFNTAIGAGTLLASTGQQNTATGAGALLTNTSGAANTADGTFALFSNTTGGGNIAVGSFALNANIAGTNNTAIGYLALRDNLGDENTGIGIGALESNTSGSFNTAVGTFAGAALSTGDNNIDIGHSVVGLAGESNTIRIGNNDVTDTFIRGISGVTVAGGDAVFVNSNGKLGTTTSSARFKDEIKPMGNASEAILALRPVSFRYKKEIDPQGIPEFGLVAEEVEKVNPDLVTRDSEGKPRTVRYEQVNAMLLNEFLQEHKKVGALEGAVAALVATVKEQASQIQKVSAQIQLRKPVQRTVANNQ
jgi:Chaperone of endosialidase